MAGAGALQPSITEPPREDRARGTASSLLAMCERLVAMVARRRRSICVPLRVDWHGGWRKLFFQLHLVTGISGVAFILMWA